MIATEPSLLRPGAVVRLRRRLWRIDEVGDTTFTATAIDGRDTARLRFLRELEESAVQSGSLPPPDVRHPGDPADQDLFLRALRLGLIHGSAPLLGLQRSRAIPEPYQLVPLLMAMALPQARLLIADDVGVGKTIEGGLVLAELIARGVVKRALVVVPAPLREQWRDALRDFFHVDAEIMAGHLRAALERRLLPGQSPWEAFPFVVVSIDYAKQHSGEILQHPWDLAIVDEAHMAARPHSQPGQAPPDMQRWDFLRRLSNAVDHLLMLTATPHSGHADSFASLIECLKAEAVSDSRVDRSIAVSYIVQRRRRDIEAWYEGRRPFPQRDQEELIITLRPAEQALLERLRQYTERIESRGPSVLNFWVAAHLQRRALSSPHALRRSLDNRRRAIARHATERPDPRLAADAEIAVMDFSSGDDLTDEERSRRVDAAAISGIEELAELEALEQLAARVTPAQDSKLAELVRLLPRRIQARPRHPRVLVFTRYRDTLEYLQRQLDRERQKQGQLSGVQLFTITGEMNQADRRAAFAAFERTPRAVCLATDCISEGLDLQRACAEIVHYELPWNPNRLEQRNGRVDRYGQSEPTVGIRTLVLRDPLDVTILEVLVRKAARIREEFGVCPAYFASGRELRALVARYGRLHQQAELPGFGADLLDEPQGPDPFDEERIRRIVGESFYGQAAVRLPEVERALQETHRTVGSPAEIAAFVGSALQRFGVGMTDHGDRTFTLPAHGDPIPELGAPMRCTFDPELGLSDPDLQVLDLAHPLVRRLVELVRDEATGQERGRFSARASREARRVVALAHILARFTSGGDRPIVMEELLTVPLPVYDDSEPVQGAELLAVPAAPLAQTAAEVTAAGEAVLGRADLADRIAQAVENRRALLAERHRSLEALGPRWGAELGAVSLASHDLLALTVVFPEHA
jgi:ERCC4-related helicase